MKAIRGSTGCRSSRFMARSRSFRCRHSLGARSSPGHTQSERGSGFISSAGTQGTIYPTSRPYHVLCRWHMRMLAGAAGARSGARWREPPRSPRMCWRSPPATPEDTTPERGAKSRAGPAEVLTNRAVAHAQSRTGAGKLDAMGAMPMPLSILSQYPPQPPFPRVAFNRWVSRWTSPAPSRCTHLQAEAPGPGDGTRFRY